MPLRDSYLDKPFNLQAQNFQLPVQQDHTPQQSQVNVLPPDKTRVLPGVLGWLDRTLLRGGGLRPGRDNDKINAYANMIQSGSLPDDQINALKERNPDAAPILSQAQLANRQRLMVTQIMQNRFADPQKPDYAGAIADLNRAGQPEMAQKLASEWHMARLSSAIPDKFKNVKIDEQGNLIGYNTETQKVEQLPADAGVKAKTTPISQYKNVQLDESGQFVGLNTKTGRVEKIPTGEGIKAESMTISPNAIENAAARYNQFGEIPPLGWGKTGVAVRAKILNRAAEMAAGKNLSPEELAVQQKVGHAQSVAMGALERQRNLILTFEKTAFANAQLALDTSEKVDRTGSPAINRWLLSGKKTIGGDPDVAKFDLAIRTFINEYARVTNSATGGGVTSDSARKEIEDALNRAYTKEQVRAVIQQAKLEMENRASAYTAQAKELTDRMAGKQAPSQPAESNVVDWGTLK